MEILSHLVLGDISIHVKDSSSAVVQGFMASMITMAKFGDLVLITWGVICSAQCFVCVCVLTEQGEDGMEKHGLVPFSWIVMVEHLPAWLPFCTVIMLFGELFKYI